MIEISLQVRCENADPDVSQQAQALADEACAQLRRALQVLATQTPISFTRSVTETQSLDTPSSRPLQAPNKPKSGEEDSAFGGPRLHEPGFEEPSLEASSAQNPSLRALSPVADLNPLLVSQVAFQAQHLGDLTEDFTPQERLLSTLKQLLVDADEVARRRGDPSLCDSLTENGEPYTSQQMQEVLSAIEEEGYEPL